MPMLRATFRELIISPCSSVSLECAFSVANYIARKERMSLDADTLKILMLLNQEELLDQIIL